MTIRENPDSVADRTVNARQTKHSTKGNIMTKTARTLTSAGLALAFAGTGVLFPMTTASAAAPTAVVTAVPEDQRLMTVSAETEALLASLGLEAYPSQWSGGLAIRNLNPENAYVIYGGYAAYEAKTIKPFSVGSYVINGTGMGYVQTLAGYEMNLQLSAHNSWREGGAGVQQDGFRVGMTHQLDALPVAPSDEILSAAGIRLHNPSTFSDCIENSCGVWVQPAEYRWVEGDGEVNEPGTYDHHSAVRLTGEAIFIPIEQHFDRVGGQVDMRDIPESAVWTYEPEKGQATATWGTREDTGDGEVAVTAYTARLTTNGQSALASTPWTYYDTIPDQILAFEPGEGEIVTYLPGETPVIEIGSWGEASATESGGIHMTLESFTRYEPLDVPETPEVPVEVPVVPVPVVPEIPVDTPVVTPEEPVVVPPAVTPEIPTVVESGSYSPATGVLLTLGAMITALVAFIARRPRAAHKA